MPARTRRQLDPATSRALVETARDLAGVLDPAQAGERIVASVMRLLRVRRSFLYRVDRAAAQLVCVAVSRPEDRQWIGARLGADEGLMGVALSTGRAARSRDVLADPRVHYSEAMRENIRSLGLGSVMAMPVAVGGQLVGAIGVGDRTGRAFTSGDVARLATLADHAAFALERARLYDEALRRRRAAEVLSDVARSLAETLDLQQVGQQIVDHVWTLLGARSAAVYLADAGSAGLRRATVAREADDTFYWPPLLPVSVGASGLVHREGRAIASADVATDPRIEYTPEMRERIVQSPHRALLAVPLVVEARALGVLVIGDATGRSFADEEVALAQAFAGHAALALDNARVHADVLRERRQAVELARIARTLTETLDVDAVGQRVAESLLDLLGVRAAYVLLLEDGVLGPVGASARPPDVAETAREWPLGVGVTGRAIAESRVVVSADVVTDPDLVMPEAHRRRFEATGRRALIAAPLSVKGRVIGAVVATDSMGRLFTETDVRLAQALADQAALALDNARLFAEGDRRRREAEALAELSRALTETLDVRLVAQRVVDSVTPLVRGQAGTLRLLQADGSLLAIAATGPAGFGASPGHVMPRGLGMSAVVLATGRTVSTADALADSRFSLPAELVERVRATGLGAWLTVPVRVKGAVIGVLAAAAPTGQVFSDPDARLLEAFADRAALALDNARLFADEDRRRREAEVAAELARSISASLDVDAVLAAVVKGARTICSSDMAFLALRDPATGEVRLRHWLGTRWEGYADLRMEPGVGSLGVVLETGRAFRTADYASDPRVGTTYQGVAREEGIVSQVLVPIAIDGRVEGVLSLCHRSRRVFTDHDEAALVRLADHAAVAIRNARLFEAERAAAEALRRSEQTLSTTRARLEHVLASNPVVLYVVHRAGEALVPEWVSESITRILGYEPSERLRVGWWVEHLHPDDRERALGNNQMLFETGHLVHEYRLRHADGTYRWIRDELRVEEADRDVIVGAWMDITERRRLEEDLQQAQKMEAIGRLAGGVAHDFNNLLTVISGRTELLLHSLPPGHPARAGAELVQRTAERAATLTRQLLAFSRKQVLQPRIIDLGAVVAGVEPMLRPLIGEDVELVTELAPGLPPITADPGQVEQVLMNLAANARDAMPRGGRLVIRTFDGASAPPPPGAAPEARLVCLAVSDTGRGMDQETRAHVFEPFFTTKGPGRGTGLGLATVYGIVAQSGGHITVESAPDVGSTFTIYLPVAAGPADEAGPRSAGRVVGGVETLLLVEDQGDLRELARDVLASLGYTVLVAGDAAEGLQRAAEHPGRIHLVVTDVVMPGENGRQMVERLHVTRPDAAVLYMSGHTDDAMIRRGILTSGVALMQKPFSPDDLARRVRDVLDAVAGR